MGNTNKKKKRIPIEKKKKGNRLPQEVAEVQETGSTDHLNPVFSFDSTCKNHFQLNELTKGELDQLIDSLRIMSSLSWAEVKKYKGLRFKGPLEHYNATLPEWLDRDVDVFEFAFSKRGRVFGYKSGRIFHIIWFDRNHDLYPMS